MQLRLENLTATGNLPFELLALNISELFLG